MKKIMTFINKYQKKRRIFNNVMDFKSGVIASFLGFIVLITTLLVGWFIIFQTNFISNETLRLSIMLFIIMLSVLFYYLSYGKIIAVKHPNISLGEVYFVLLIECLLINLLILTIGIIFITSLGRLS